MDEREEAGMKALTEGVKRGSEAGAAGAGMLVSIVHILQKPMTCMPLLHVVAGYFVHQ
jgi:hypothetical protein